MLRRLPLLYLTCIAFLTAVVLPAQTVSGIGPGGNIPGNAPFANSGMFLSDAVINGGGTVASGNAVTVTLKGLQHGWSGDLIATLSYLDQQGNLGAAKNIFFRIGQTSDKPEGSWVGFGTPDGTGDNYTFNSAASGDMWRTASALGYADWIPGLQTDTVNQGQYFTTDPGGAQNNLSSAFAGLDVASGTWRLTIIDLFDHASEGSSISNTGSIVGWEIDIDTSPSDSANSGQLKPTASAASTSIEAPQTPMRHARRKPRWVRLLRAK